MRLICPACGITASAEVWTQEIACRETVQACLQMPAPVNETVLAYLALFRPEKTALSWHRARRLALDLQGMVTTGWVQIKGQPARPCPPKIWAAAMEEMLARRIQLRRPLTNHNYLRQVAWTLADQADLARERNEEKARQNQGRGAGGMEQIDWQSLTESEKLRLPHELRQKYLGEK